MDDLYILPMQTAGPLYDPAYTLPGTFDATATLYTYVTKTTGTLTYTKIIYPLIGTNPSGNYDVATGIYTANRAGTYTMRIGECIVYFGTEYIHQFCVYGQWSGNADFCSNYQHSWNNLFFGQPYFAYW